METSAKTQLEVQHDRLEQQARGVRIVGDFFHSTEPLGTAVLLHGGGQTRFSWSGTAEALARNGWSTLSLDARGHGESGWAPDGDYSLDAMVDDLACVLDTSLPSNPPVLIGASMGGMAALIAEGERGPIARALVLVDIVPRPEPRGVERIVQFMTAHLDGFASLDEVASAVEAYNPTRKRSDNLEGLKKNVRLRDDGRWYWHWDPAMLKLPTSHDGSPSKTVDRMMAAAARVQVPTLVVRGAKSDVVSDEGVRELLAVLPNGSTASVAGTGHMVAGDDNTAFARTIADYLSTLPQTVSLR